MGPCPCGHGSGVKTCHMFAVPHWVKRAFDVRWPSRSIGLHRLQTPREYIIKRERLRLRTIAHKRSRRVFNLLLR